MLHMRFDEIPISSDHAYESVAKGSGRARIIVRRLSDEGKRYKTAIKQQVLRRYPEALRFFQQDHTYLLLIKFTFGNKWSLCNATWNTGENGAQSRYKRLDVSNRIKLFEDALAEAVAVDDKHNFFIGVLKDWSNTGHESVDVWAYDRELESDNPIDALFYKLTGLAKPDRAVPALPESGHESSPEQHSGGDGSVPNRRRRAPRRQRN